MQLFETRSIRLVATKLIAYVDTCPPECTPEAAAANCFHEASTKQTPPLKRDYLITQSAQTLQCWNVMYTTVLYRYFEQEDSVSEWKCAPSRFLSSRSFSSSERDAARQTMTNESKNTKNRRLVAE